MLLRRFHEHQPNEDQRGVRAQLYPNNCGGMCVRIIFYVLTAVVGIVCEKYESTQNFHKYSK